MNPSNEKMLEPVDEGRSFTGYISKKRRWQLAIFALGLIALWAVWRYSVFDPEQAALRGYRFVVTAIVRLDPGIVNRPIGGGSTLLYAATYGDHPEIVEFLLESGADPNLPTGGHPCGPTPVHAAASEGSAESLKLLIEAGADFDGRKDCDDEPPILEAAQRGHVEVVKVLLDAGVDPNRHDWYQDPWDEEPRPGMNALEWAAIHGHAEVVKLLVERGASVKFSNNGRSGTALHTFCNITPIPEVEAEQYKEWVRNLPTIVDLFVKQLGNVNYPEGGDTPLHEAAGNLLSSSDDIMRHLVKNYPELDVNAKGDFGATPLHRAMTHPKQLHSVKFLVENCPKLDVNATDDSKRTPLHKGATHENVAGVRFLLENCPTLNVNATDYRGFTPLNTARWERSSAKHENDQKAVEALTEIMKLLEAHGGRIDEEAKRKPGMPIHD